MILLQAQNPLNGSLYTFTKRQVKLTAPQARSGAQVKVRGMHGVLDAYSGVEDTMNATEVTYQITLFPKEDKTTLDALKHDLYVAVAHGLPQTLYFRDDNGQVWLAQNAKSIGYPVDVGVYSWANGQAVNVTWRLNNPFLRLSHQAGELLWGDQNANATPVLWGQTSPSIHWGQSASNFVVNSGSFDTTIHNPLATVISADVIINLACDASHNYGPTFPGNPLAPGTDPNGIRFLNRDAVFFGNPIEFRVLDILNPGDSYAINFPAKSAYKAGGAWRNLWRPVNQRQWFMLVPGDNRINVSVRGTLSSVPQMSVNLISYPRTLL